MRASPEAWDHLENLADEFHAPLAGLALRAAIAVPPAVCGVELVGAGLVFGAAKLADRTDAVVLRCVNVTARATRGAWRFPDRIARASLTRLDETPVEELTLQAHGHEAWFDVPARGIVTVLVQPEA